MRHPSGRGNKTMDARNHSLRACAGRSALEKHSDSPILSPSLTAEQVYHDYALRVYSVARSMVSSDTDAEDVMQVVLLQVIRKLRPFAGTLRFRPGCTG